MLDFEVAQELRSIQIDIDNARYSFEKFDDKGCIAMIDSAAQKITTLLKELDGTN